MKNDTNIVCQAYLAERQLSKDLRALSELVDTITEVRYNKLQPLIIDLQEPKDYAIHSKHKAVLLAQQTAIRLENLLRNLCTSKISEECDINEDLPDMDSLHSFADNILFSVVAENDIERASQLIERTFVKLQNDAITAEAFQEEMAEREAEAIYAEHPDAQLIEMIPLSIGDPAGNLSYEQRRMDKESAEDLVNWIKKLSIEDKKTLCHVVMLRFLSECFKCTSQASMMRLIGPKGMSDFLPELCRMVCFASSDFEDILCEVAGMSSQELFKYMYEKIYIEHLTFDQFLNEIIKKGEAENNERD